MNDIFKTVLSLSLSGSIIAIILFAVKPLLKDRISKTWQYYIWLVVILRLLIPFTSEINILNGLFNSTEINAIIPKNNVSPNYQLDNEEPLNQQAGDNLLNEIEISQNVIENDIISDNNTSSIDNFGGYLSAIQENGWLVWLLISSILLLKKIISYHVYFSYIKSNRNLITDESIIATYDEVCYKAGIKRNVKLYSYKKINSPMLIGFVKPYILLPETMLKTTDGLQYILMHELTHYRRLDFLYKWCVQIAVCVHFFNPVVYFVRKSINKACEFSCDEMVVKKLDEQSKKAYGTSLIDALELSAGYNQPAISFMLCEDVKIIKERLGAIMNYKRSTKLVTVFTLFLTAIFSLGAMFTGVYAQAKVIEPKNVLENSAVMSTETEKDLKNIPAIQNATIDAYAYNGNWADGKGFNSNTYKGQLDEKIEYIEALYEDKKEPFVIFENVSETEIANSIGIEYMFNNSSVYRDMVTVKDSLFISSKDRLFTSFYNGGVKEYQRSVFYIDKPATLALKVNYALTQGKLSIYVVSPNEEIVYQNKPSKQFDETIDISLDKGLWSIILLNEYENSRIYGKKEIGGNINYSTGQLPLIEDSVYKLSSPYADPTEQIDINLPLIEVSGYNEYGPYDLKKGDVISSDLTWSNFEGGIYFAIGKEYYDFKGFHSTYGKWDNSLKKDIVVQEDGLYFIYVGNPSTDEPDVENVSGKIMINRKKVSSFQADKNSYTSRADSLTQNFEKYKLFGVTYNAEQDAVYYNGERVKLFVDFKPYKEEGMTYAFDFCYQGNEKTKLYLEVIEDSNGNIKGIQRLDDAIALDMLGELNSPNAGMNVNSMKSMEGLENIKKLENLENNLDDLRNTKENVKNDLKKLKDDLEKLKTSKKVPLNSELLYLTMDATHIIESADIVAKDLTTNKLDEKIINWIAECDKKEGAYILKINAGSGYDTYVYYNGGGRYPWYIDKDGDNINISLYSKSTLCTTDGYYLMHYTAPKDYKNISIYLDSSKLSYDVTYS